MILPKSFCNSGLRAAWMASLLCLALLIAACSGAKEKAESTASDAASAVKDAAKSAVTGGDFEGVIAMQVKTPASKPMEMTYFVKGERARVETSMPESPMGSAVMLWDMPNGKMTMLLPPMKAYMTFDAKEMGDEIRAGQEKDASGEAKFPKLTATGKTETIAGHQCEHYLMGDKQEIDMCVAKGLGYFGMGNQAGGMAAMKNLIFSPKMLAEAAAHPEWVKLLQGGAFPLKMTVSEGGKPGVTMEATKIERKPLDDALFTVPADYKEQKMPAMPKGFPTR
jgi:hypothetical protein